MNFTRDFVNLGAIVGNALNLQTGLFGRTRNTSDIGGNGHRRATVFGQCKCNFGNDVGGALRREANHAHDLMGFVGDICRGGNLRLAVLHVRGDVPREVSPHWQGLKDTRRRLVRIVPWWLVALFTLVCLVVMYGGFAWVLGEQRETILQPYEQLDPSAGVSMDDLK